MIALNFVEIKSAKIPQAIVQQIRKKLEMGTLSPGEMLPPETKLAEMFGVSRSSIREAMQTLEGMGIVNRRKRGGTMIRQITSEDLFALYTPKPENESLVDLLETREALELAVVKLVVRRASSEELDELDRLITWMEKEPEKAASADIAFHITLARLSQNHVMTNIIKSLKEIMTQLQEKTIFYPGRIVEIIDEHRQIVAAIRGRDEQAAQDCMRLHINHVNVLLKKM